MRGRKKKTNPLRKNRCWTTPPFSPTRGFNIALIQFPPALEAKLNKLALHMFNLLKHRKPLLEEKPKLTSEIELLLVLGQLRPVLHEWPLGIYETSLCPRLPNSFQASNQGNKTCVFFSFPLEANVQNWWLLVIKRQEHRVSYSLWLSKQ